MSAAFEETSAGTVEEVYAQLLARARRRDPLERLSKREREVLEMRLTYQDDAMETLNGAITAQWNEIDALRRQIATLREQLAEDEDRAGGPRNEPPPHY